jgi:excisionase family DNA binding protein
MAELAHMLTKDQVAERLQITRRTLEEWCKRGLLPYFKFGRTVRFDPGDLSAVMDKNFRIGRRK